MFQPIFWPQLCYLDNQDGAFLFKKSNFQVISTQKHLTNTLETLRNQSINSKYWKKSSKTGNQIGFVGTKKFILVVWNGLNDDFFSHHQNPATLLFLIRDWKIIQIIFCSKTDFIDILRNLNHIIYVIFNIWEPKCISHIISCTSSVFDAF